MFSKNLPLAFLIIVLFLGFRACQLMKGLANTNPILNHTIELTIKEDNRREKLTDLADNFLGKKYKYAGKTPKTGFDCSGFTYYLMKNVEVKIPASSTAQSKIGQKVALENSKAGDLVFFKKGKKNRIFHVAMVYSNSPDDLRIIHSTSSRGVVIDELYTSKYWEPKISHVRNVLAVNTP